MSEPKKVLWCEEHERVVTDDYVWHRMANCPLVEMLLTPTAQTEEEDE